MSERELSIENIIAVQGEQNPLHERIVSKLREAFGDVAHFFWNSRNANCVGVLWKPVQFLSSKFTVVASRHSLIADNSESSFLIKNSAEVVKEMLSISEGMLSASSF